MKTKLLKKVRRRFEILYCPKGRNIDGEHMYEDGCVSLIDKGLLPNKYISLEEYNFPIVPLGKDFAHQECIDTILHIINKKYRKTRNLPIEKLWWNGGFNEKRKPLQLKKEDMKITTIDNKVYECVMVDFYTGYVLVIAKEGELRIDISNINFIVK